MEIIFTYSESLQLKFQKVSEIGIQAMQTAFRFKLNNRMAHIRSELIRTHVTNCIRYLHFCQKFAAAPGSIFIKEHREPLFGISVCVLCFQATKFKR